MTPDDPRHGTNAGYTSGCRNLCCRRAHMVWMKRYRLGLSSGLVPALGSHRRLQALVRIGWSLGHLGQRLGHDRNYFLKVLEKDRINVKTRDTIAALYAELSMIIPTDDPGSNASHLRARRFAEAKGWPPPLAWDNIDDPNEHPEGWEYVAPKRTNQYHRPPIDPVVVMRLLQGDKVPSTPEERTAAMERWIADGGTQAELCAWHGWREGSYKPGLTLVRGGAA